MAGELREVRFTGLAGVILMAVFRGISIIGFIVISPRLAFFVIFGIIALAVGRLSRLICLWVILVTVTIICSSSSVIRTAIFALLVAAICVLTVGIVRIRFAVVAFAILIGLLRIFSGIFILTAFTSIILRGIVIGALAAALI